MPQSLVLRPCAALLAAARRFSRAASDPRSSGLRFLARWAHALPLLAAVALAVPAAAAPLSIHKLEWSFVAPDPAAAVEPGATQSRTTFDLPLHWSTDAGAPLRHVSLRLTFALAAVPAETWAVFLPHLTEGGNFRVNGHFIGAVSRESEGRHVAWRRPQLLAIDPSLLLAGDNDLVIETSYGPGAHALSTVEVGALSGLWNAYAVQFFLAYLSAWAGATMALLTALVFGALWWQRREEISRLLALTAGAWLAYSGAWLVEIMPVEFRLPVQLLGMGAMAAFSAMLAVTFLRLSELSRRRELWLIGLYAALGPLASLATSMRADPYLEMSWRPGLIVVIAIATGVGVYRRTQGQPAPHPLVLVAAVILLIADLLDFGSMIGRDGLDGIPAMNFAAPLVLAALATPLVGGFIKMMHEAQMARAELETRVREREQLLKRNFERLRESERIKVEAQERQRIMQDMHDGLGSQLLSSLMLVERGAVSNDQFAQILRESIDDMRLAIDALAAEHVDLAAALGNLRFRMEPRMRAAGMELTWDARRLPEELGLHPDVVLPILRIVQEALTNALKHSRARAVRVTLATEGTGDTQALDIRIADNGRGVAEERVGGRGLLNMRNRAQKIGAQLKLETAPNVGTTVHLRARIGPISPTTRAPQTILNTQAIIERARQQ
jgi:signal transduction histidine kinase